MGVVRACLDVRKCMCFCEVSGTKAEVAYTKHKKCVAVGWQWWWPGWQHACVWSQHGGVETRGLWADINHKACTGVWCPCMNASVVREGVGADGEKVLCLGLTQLAGGCWVGWGLSSAVAPVHSLYKPRLCASRLSSLRAPPFLAGPASRPRCAPARQPAPAHRPCPRRHPHAATRRGPQRPCAWMTHGCGRALWTLRPGLWRRASTGCRWRGRRASCLR